MLDFDIQESVSKLESDIMKTVENNNNKLKELQHLLNEEKKSKKLIAKVTDDDENILPIVEAGEEVLEIVTKPPPPSVDKVEEDYVVEDVSLLKKLIAETDKTKPEVIEEIVVDNNQAVETTTAIPMTMTTPVEVITTEKQTVETSTETTTVQTTTVALVTTLTTPSKVRLFAARSQLSSQNGFSYRR